MRKIMKKLIKGRRYDTEKAKKCGSDSSGMPGDPKYWKEELFKKRTGEFFLHASGGAGSDYAKQVKLNTWVGGETLIPLSYYEAWKWAEDHLNPGTYEKLFGIVEEMDRTTVTLSIPAAVADMLRKHAAKTGRTISEIASEAIQAACEHTPAQKGKSIKEGHTC